MYKLLLLLLLLYLLLLNYLLIHLHTYCKWVVTRWQ